MAHTWTLWSAAWPSVHVRHDRGHDGLNLRARPRRVSATASASGCAGRLAPCAGLSRHLCVSMAAASTATARDIAQTPPHQDFRTKSFSEYEMHLLADAKNALTKPLALISFCYCFVSRLAPGRFFRGYATSACGLVTLVEPCDLAQSRGSSSLEEFVRVLHVLCAFRRDK